MEIAGEIFPPRGVWRINTLSGASQCDSNGHKHEDIQPKADGKRLCAGSPKVVRKTVWAFSRLGPPATDRDDRVPHFNPGL